MAGKDLDHIAGDGVADLLVPDVLDAVDLEDADALDVPPQAEVRLADLPVLDENKAPETVEDGEGDGVGAEVPPAENAAEGGDNQKARVAVDKGEVECDLSFISYDSYRCLL